MTFHHSEFSAEHFDESKPTSRRRAGGKMKKPAHGNGSKFGPFHSRSRRSEFEEDFDDFDIDDLDDDEENDDFHDDEDLDDFDDDDVDFFLDEDR